MNTLINSLVNRQHLVMVCSRWQHTAKLLMWVSPSLFKHLMFCVHVFHSKMQNGQWFVYIVISSPTVFNVFFIAKHQMVNWFRLSIFKSHLKSVITYCKIVNVCFTFIIQTPHVCVHVFHSKMQNGQWFVNMDISSPTVFNVFFHSETSNG